MAALQANFPVTKSISGALISSGGGFVTSELAAKIVHAGPHLEHANGDLKAKRYSVEL